MFENQHNDVTCLLSYHIGQCRSEDIEMDVRILIPFVTKGDSNDNQYEDFLMFRLLTKSKY